MAQKKRAKKRKTKKQQKQQEKLMLVGVGLLFVLFSIFGFFHLGFLGTLIANGFRIVGGNTYKFLSVALAAYGVWLAIKTTDARFKSIRRVIGCVLVYFGLLIILHAQIFSNVVGEQANIFQTTWMTLLGDIRRSQVTQNVGGGMIGAMLYGATYFLVSQIGSYIIAVLLILIGAFLFSQMSSHELVEHLQAAGDKLQRLLEGSPEKQAEREARKAERAAEKQAAKEAKKEAERAAVMAEIKEKNQVRPMTEDEKSAKEQQMQAPDDFEPEQLSFVPIDHFQELPQAAGSEAAQAPHPAGNKPGPSKKVNEDGEILDDDGEVLEFEISEEAENRDYELPSAQLLDSIPSTDQSSEYKKIEQNIGVLETTFQSFGVDAKVVKASLGPAVTKFEVQPAVGVKVSKIVGLTDDIALALAAKDVRMEAPIPGKSLIGIEVPNSAVSMVSFREVIEAQPDHPDKLLEVPLGRDISGRVQTADLTKMPHLLIAGSTGSGKSVAINGIITSILMRAKPHEVKLMMIDPKMVELNVYNGIPHLLTPVVTNPRKAAQALQKVVKEMEERYEKFAATGVRNITGYNDLVINKNLEDGENRPILPFIVVIVDELADLMMVASNEVEDAIIRLAQMARAAGIHMILATQRPSVDVITGIIKANVPSRMAFAVSSGVDSRTIIDGNGAEKLLGRGDMLYLPMGENKPIRVQGAFISDQEVERVVEFVTDQQEANYEEKMMVTEEETSTGSSGQPQDELFEDAKALVVEMQTASVSLLQRRFRIGYNRAARLVDELEDQGVVGPSEGSKPRKVLIEPQPEDIPTFDE
ncbi:FtsK/SpoIIIE family DNA translocase [Enterococcus casseliflavus]|uniref:FtsK/SpoIIIE family DNA translocase n=1 Tax=Enterococcus casseliflavus TaxID=37734 RepID=UPI00232AE254|nr:DNA translocase FtsK [Enterococcus casseliflavus]MDB1687798.1 DNA translocase FtsK [Enterococcus casseliflavus]